MSKNDERDRLERALADPSAVYSDPEAVLRDTFPSLEEKRKILERWEFDVAELAVATDEGMPLEENRTGEKEESLTRRILLARQALEPEASRHPVGPAKHHVPSETP